MYASHFLEDLDSCEEVVQAGFVAYWEKVRAGKEPENPRAYLYATVRNGCLNALRRRWLAGERDVPVDLEGVPDEEAVERSFEEARIWTAIDALPERRREILLMSKRDGVPPEEIAEHFGISERTVRNQISRALQALRRGAKKVYLFLFG